MISIVHLPLGQDPADNEWLLVQSYPGGKYMIFASVSFATQGPFDTAETALDEAEKMAMKWGLSTIYANGLPHHAKRP